MKRSFFTKMSLGFLSVCALVLGAVGLNTPTTEPITASASTCAIPHSTVWATTSGTASGGDYYLDGAKTATGNITVSGTVTLCLNGNKLDMGAYYITVGSGASLNICDCQGGGSIVSASEEKPITNWAYVACIYNKGGTVNVMGGSISNNVHRDEGYNAWYGCGIFSYDGGVTVSGGTVGGYYGVVCDGDTATTCNVTGGTISAVSAGVNVVENVTLNVTSGTITANGSNSVTTGIRVDSETATAKISGGNVSSTNYGIYDFGGHTYLSGAPTIKGENGDIAVYKYNTKQTFLSAKIDTAPYAGDKLTVTSNSSFAAGDTIVSDVIEENKDKFEWKKADGLSFEYKAESSALVLKTLHSHNDVSFDKAWETVSGEVATGNYYLADGVSATEAISLASGATVNLCLNGNTLDLGAYSLTVPEGTTLNIYDCDGNGEITSADNLTLSVQGTLTLHNGTIKNKQAKYYPAVSVTGSGSFDMYGGTLTSGTPLILESSSCTVKIFGGVIESKAYYAIQFNAKASLYLSGTPNITVPEGKSHIRAVGGTTEYGKIIPHAYEDIATKYSGSVLMVEVASSGEGYVLVDEVDDDTASKFTVSNNGYTAIRSGDKLLMHKHSYAYAVSENVVTESCGCGHEKKATLSAPLRELVYDGESFNASIAYEEGWVGEQPTAIKYTKNTVATSDTTGAGEYVADITIEEKTATLSYTVAPKTVTIDWVEDDFTYNGADQRESITAAYDDIDGNPVALAVSGDTFKDYAASGYEFSVSFASDDPNYALPSEVSKTYNMKKAELTVVAKDNTITYGDAPTANGVACSGFVGGEDEGVLDGDLVYDYSYEQYDDVGDSYTITPKGLTADNYAITFAEGTLTVVQKDITGADVKLDDAPIYDSTEKEQAIVFVMIDELEVTFDVSGNRATDVGESDYTLTVTGKDNFKGTVNANWNILPLDITGAEIVLGEALTYTGEEQTQTIASVTIDSLTVTYDVSGNEATDVGESDYTLTVTGTGNFKGTADKAWNILPLDITDAEIELGEALTYTGEEQTQTVASVTIDGLTLTADDYDLSDNEQTLVSAEDYILKVTGKGNFTGVAEKAWSIAKAKAVISVNTSPIVKTYGEKWSLPVASSNFGTVVCDKTVAQMVNANSYEVRYSVAGTDDYDGDVETVSVTIQKIRVTKPIGSGKIYVYNGNAQTYYVTTSSAYTVSGNVRTDAGEQDVTVVLKDKANYCWTDGTTTDIVFRFKINKADPAIAVDEEEIVKIYGEAWELPVVTSKFGEVVCDKTVADMVNAGTYLVTYSVEGAENYNSATKTVTVVIEKATYDMSGVTLSDKAVKYDGKAQSIEIEGALPAGVTVTYEGNGKVEAGVYTVTATFTYDGANYNEIQPMTATLTVKQAEMVDHVGETATEKPSVIVFNDEGFAPEIEIVITEIAVENAQAGATLGKKEVIGSVFDITMKSEGATVQPNGKITIKLLIPEDVSDKDFYILHNHNGVFSKVEHTVEGDYAVFSVDKLSEFLFIYEEAPFPWWIILVAVIVLAVGGFAIYWFAVKKKTFADLKAVFQKKEENAREEK